jgi:hypothetical protein
MNSVNSSGGIHGLGAMPAGFGEIDPMDSGSVHRLLSEVRREQSTIQSLIGNATPGELAAFSNGGDSHLIGYA